MINTINSLKNPKDIVLSEVRKYNDNTPSVTWLLSLYVSYTPRDEEALKRWTHVHKFIENFLLWNEMEIKNYSKYKISIMPYLNMLKNVWKDEKVLAEDKLTIDWVFWWTIDYTVLMKNNACILIDFKTKEDLSVIQKTLRHKYERQMISYQNLIRYKLNLKILDSSLLMITEEWCNFISQEWSVTRKYAEDAIPLLYFHYLNNTLHSEEMVSYFLDDNKQKIDEILFQIQHPRRNSLLEGWTTEWNQEVDKIFLPFIKELKVFQLSVQFKKWKKAFNL